MQYDHVAPHFQHLLIRNAYGIKRASRIHSFVVKPNMLNIQSTLWINTVEKMNVRVE